MGTDSLLPLHTLSAPALFANLLAALTVVTYRMDWHGLCPLLYIKVARS